MSTFINDGAPVSVDEVLALQTKAITAKPDTIDYLNLLMLTSAASGQTGIQINLKAAVLDTKQEQVDNTVAAIKAAFEAARYQVEVSEYNQEVGYTVSIRLPKFEGVNE